MLYTNKRRDWDLNPGEVNPHGISSPAPYQARLSQNRRKIKIIATN